MYNEEEMKLINEAIEELQGKIVQSSATNATAGLDGYVLFVAEDCHHLQHSALVRGI